jgi:polyphosphate kinase
MSFLNDGEPEYWFGSADIMHRNLDRRVEVLLKVNDETAQAELETMFDAAMAPGVECWELRPDASWERLPGTDYQSRLMARASARPG